MKNTRGMSLAQRLEHYSIPIPNCGCIVWLGGAYRNGYGVVSTGGQAKMSAHRAAWTVAHGAIPDGLHVLHKCDVRPCINPDHLFLGTCKDNMVDKAMKGRAAAKDDRRGALNSRAILTEEQAQEIASSPATQHELARKYGVSRGAISGIKTGKNWKHLHYRNGDQNHG